jgi:Fic-DOC domain mobile mystery protein B
MEFKIVCEAGATDLDPDELSGLLPTHLIVQAQLNEWEQVNILNAEKWLGSRKPKNVLSEEFCRSLHKKMFDQTWSWAGTFRCSDKNIGVDWTQISVNLKNLLEDTKYWLKHQVYSLNEVGARFHHHLVSIHCFPNGNGRHARLMTDALMIENGRSRFSWGSLMKDSVLARSKYLESLRAADKGNLEPLKKFLNS